MIREKTVATKPDHRGELEAAVKTIRAGKVEPIDFACGDCPRAFFARKPRVKANARPSLRPQLLGDAIVKTRASFAARAWTDGREKRAV